MQEEIRDELKGSISVKTETMKTLVPVIEEAAKALIEAFKQGNKVMICGNGGSAADSQHFAAELIGRYKKDRPSLPAIALSTDTSIITSIGNDYGFGAIFAKQVEGLGSKGDILVGISTSGNSKNVMEAFSAAKLKGVGTIALLGCGGGRMAETADIAIVIPSDSTPRIQECHGTVIHILCGLVEKELFAS